MRLNLLGNAYNWDDDIGKPNPRGGWGIPLDRYFYYLDQDHLNTQHYH